MKKKTLILLLLLVMTVPVLAQRSVIKLDPQWKFLRSDVSDAQISDFDDSSWQTVNVPHTFNALDGQDGGRYYRGPAWYRKSLDVPAEYNGKCVYLYFDAVGRVADVYCNGQFVGRHMGAYAAFTFDISDYLRYGAVNQLAVKVDNSGEYEIPPISGDFTQWGGICRKVSLVVTEPAHFTLQDYASTGVYLKTTNVSESSATLEVKALVRNAGESAADYTVKSSVLDANGSVIATLTSQEMVAGGGSEVFLASTQISDPHLWNGLQDPYLYSVKCELLSAGGVVDTVVEPLGFRYYSVDKDKGFLLNGKYLDLRGVAMHEDREDLGRAISDDDRREDFALMREMGCTWLRLSHYQHSKLLYQMADKEGVVLYTEIPTVNGVGRTPLFAQNARQQLIELIRQNYNHPSVCFWGVFNEITNDGKAPNPVPLMKELNDLAKSEDPTRISIAAACGADNHPTTYVTETVCYNKYFGWYNDHNAYMGEWADKYHSRRPDTIMGISEYGAGAGVTMHELNPAQPSPGGFWHPEEYQAIFHENHWKDMKTRPFIWCKTIWNGFDFGADHRDEGEKPGYNDKGMVTRDRKIKKDAFYWYKANWNSEPMVYITSRRNTPLAEQTVDVKAYSNCNSVTLLLNGKAIGTANVKDCIAIWPGVKLAQGENELTVQAKGLAVKDTCSWLVIPGKKLDIKAVSASSEYGGNEVIANINDGKPGTRWTANNPQWLLFDFGRKVEVDKMYVKFYRGAQRKYAFSVECSDNNNDWRSISGAQVSSGTTSAYEGFDLGSTKARYIRVNCNGSDYNSWNSYCEVLFMGN